VTTDGWSFGADVTNGSAVAREGDVPPQRLTDGGAGRPGVPTVVRVPRPLRVVLLALSMLLSLSLLPSSASFGVDVHGDDGKDLYIGTGGLVIPSSDWKGDEGGRQSAAACEGCTWRVTSYCTHLEYDSGSCPGSHVGCPVDQLRVRVWLQQAGEPWQYLGPACIGDRPWHTRTDVGSAVRDRAEQALPALRAGVQPPDSVLVGLPAVFRTGQPADGIVDADLSVLALSVRLDARVRWLWSWGDGSTEWSSSPGGVWPDMTLTHTYRHAGATQASVVSVWRGEYLVEGLGPFVVPGDPLTQTQGLSIDVREAHALLVR